MAFGKDREQLGKVSAFGGGSFSQRNAQFMRNQDQQKKRRSGGGGLRYQDIYKPTKGATPDEGRIIPGSYKYISAGEGDETQEMVLEFYPFIEHFDGRTQRSAICSGGPFHFKRTRTPCEGCEMFFSTMEKDSKTGGKKKGRVSKREMFAFNFLHYWPYHKVEQLDNDGTPRCGTDGKPYMEWVRCDGRGCGMCGNRETEPCRLLQWPMGFSHYKALTEEYRQQIGNSCGNCSGRDTVFTEAWLCPSCGEAMIEMDTTTLKDEDIAKITKEPYVCSHCRTNVLLTEAYRCTACPSARRAELWDVDIKVKRMETGKGDKDGATQLIVSSWSEPRALDARYAGHAKPLELAKIYEPSSIEQQRKAFDLADGQSSSTPQTQAPAPQRGQPLQRTPSNTGRPFRTQ